MIRTRAPQAVAATGTVNDAIKAIESEYKRQVESLALSLRSAFECGAFGSTVRPVDADNSEPYERLRGAVAERVKLNPASIRMVQVGSPNRWQALDSHWETEEIAALEAIVVDLCVFAETQGWARIGIRSYWKEPSSPTPVRSFRPQAAGRAA